MCSVPISEACRQALLDQHNAVRAAVVTDTPLPSLTWDPDLESIAQTWASGCQNTSGSPQLLDHNPNRSNGFPEGVGENIFASTGTAPASLVVGSWASEAQYYDITNNTCQGQRYTAQSPVWGACGHYTQLVTRRTTRVGCGVSNCAQIPYPRTVVCNYAPAGNIYSGPNLEFERPY